MAAALTVGAAPTFATAADPPNTTTDTRPLYKRMFFSPKPKPDAGPGPRNGVVAAPPGQPPISKPLSPEAVGDALRAEQDAYLRRLNVCVELRKAAIERNDEALMREIDEFERQAEALYKQRIAALGISRTVRAPLPSSNNAFAASLEIAPEKPVDPKAAAAKLVAPAAPVPISETAGLPPASPDVREVKPEGGK
jgi:hypothetical protein